MGRARLGVHGHEREHVVRKELGARVMPVCELRCEILRERDGDGAAGTEATTTTKAVFVPSAFNVITTMNTAYVLVHWESRVA
jgi:hypothetical protein